MKLNFTFKPMYYFLLLVWPFWRICHFSHSKIASNYVTDISDRCKWYANYKLKLPVSVVYSKEVTFWQTDRHGKLRLPVSAVYSKGQTDRHGKLRLPVSAVYSKRVYVQTDRLTDRHGNLKLPVSAVYS